MTLVDHGPLRGSTRRLPADRGRLPTPVLFILTGGFTTAVNLLSRYLMSFILPYGVAIVLAYSLGMLIGFVLFKRVVFMASTSNNTRKEVWWYIAVNAASLLVTLLASLLLKDYVFPALSFSFRPADLAHFVGVFLGAWTNYFGHKHLTFRR